MSKIFAHMQLFLLSYRFRPYRVSANLFTTIGYNAYFKLCRLQKVQPGDFKSATWILKSATWLHFQATTHRQGDFGRFLFFSLQDLDKFWRFGEIRCPFQDPEISKVQPGYFLKLGIGASVYR